jgi:hypothetical protein
VKRPPHERLPGEDQFEEYGQPIAYVQADDGNRRHGVQGDGVVERRQAEQEREQGREPEGIDRHIEPGMDLMPHFGEEHGAVAAEGPHLPGLWIRGLRALVRLRSTVGNL